MSPHLAPVPTGRSGCRASASPPLPFLPLLLPSPVLPPQTDLYGGSSAYSDRRDEHGNKEEGSANPALSQLLPPPPPGTPNWSDLLDMDTFGPCGRAGGSGDGWPVEEGAEEVTESNHSGRASDDGSGRPYTNGVNGNAEDAERYRRLALGHDGGDDDNEDADSSSSWGLLGQSRYDEELMAAIGLSVPPRRRQRQGQAQGEARPSQLPGSGHVQTNGKTARRSGTR